MADLMEYIFRGRPRPTDTPTAGAAPAPLGPQTRQSALASTAGVAPPNPALTAPQIGGRTGDAQMQAEGQNMLEIEKKLGGHLGKHGQEIPGWKELKLLPEAEAFERAVALAGSNPDGFISSAENLGGLELRSALNEVLGATDWPDKNRAAADLVKERLGPYGLLGILATGEPAPQEILQ